MATEPCPQCGAAWPEGQQTCPSCGFIRPPEGATFRSGLTGVHPAPGPTIAGPPVPPGPSAPPTEAAGVWQPQPPQAEWPPQQPPTRAEWPPPVPAGPSGPRAAVSPLAVIGSILLGVGGVVPWFDFNWDLTGFKVPLSLLFGNVEANPGSAATSVGLALVVVGVIALLVSVTPAPSVLRRALGLVGIAGPVLFVFQALTHDISVGDLIGHLGPGVYMAFVGGLLLLLAPARQPARR